jgi:hypothetical protein
LPRRERPTGEALDTALTGGSTFVLRTSKERGATFVTRLPDHPSEPTGSEKEADPPNRETHSQIAGRMSVDYGRMCTEYE